MKLVDSRNRELNVGQRVRIEQDIPSPDGMLYKDSIVKLDEFNDKTKKIRVTDNLIVVLVLQLFFLLYNNLYQVNFQMNPRVFLLYNYSKSIHSTLCEQTQ